MAVAPLISTRSFKDTQPYARPKPKRQGVAIPRAQILENVKKVVLLGLLSASVAYATFGFSVLLGNSVKESASRETSRALARAHTAMVDIEVLRQQADRKVTMDEIERWSVANGFEASITRDAQTVSSIHNDTNQ